MYKEPTYEVKGISAAYLRVCGAWQFFGIRTEGYTSISDYVLKFAMTMLH